MKINSIDQRWILWNECLAGNDTNSIYQQIFRMNLDTVIFHIINESAKVKTSEEVEINSYFFNFTIRNYFQSQCVAIRRLLEDSYSLTDGRGIYSLESLIKDINDYRKVLTRKEFFRLRKIQYDYSKVRKKEREYIKKQCNESFSKIPDEYNSELIEETHILFDRLSGKNKNTRSKEDMIAEKVFRQLNKKLQSCKNIQNYVNKFIAHSATPESRQTFDKEEYKVTFGNLWEAHRTIFQVANFLSNLLSSTFTYALPFVKPNFYDFWDKPLYHTDDVEKVREILDSYINKTEKWILDENESMRELFK